MSDLRIEMIAGYCPVQAEGTIDGVPFYFRARGRRWSMSIGKNPVSILTTIEANTDEWYAESTWGLERFAAGWMPEAEARRLVEWCASEYAKNAARAPPAAGSDLEATTASQGGKTGASDEICRSSGEAGKEGAL